MLERSEHAELIEANRQRVDTNKDLYRRRQAIVEHPYGIIKRQWGFSYILTKKGMKRASADVGLMLVAFNMRRIITIIGFDGLQKWLQSLAFRLLEQFYTFFAHHQLPLQLTQIRKYFSARSLLYPIRLYIW